MVSVRRDELLDGVVTNTISDSIVPHGLETVSVEQTGNTGVYQRIVGEARISESTV